jgi:hypothetical protein
MPGLLVQSFSLVHRSWQRLRTDLARCSRAYEKLPDHAHSMVPGDAIGVFDHNATLTEMLRLDASLQDLATEMCPSMFPSLVRYVEAGCRFFVVVDRHPRR